MEEAHDGCLAPGSRVRPGVHLLMLLTQVVVGSYLVVAKIALSGGVQQLVFAVYRDAFGICLLIPFAYFYELKTRKWLTLEVLARYTCLGFVGMYLNQILLYTGLILTSATFAAAMQMLVPVFTLIIATIFQLESIQWKQRWGQAKILGILASVTGAVVMISYKGPPLLENRFTANLLPVPVEFLPAGLRSFLHSLSAVVGFQMDPWKIGAISLVGSSLCLASFINIQAVTLAKHTAPVSLAASVFTIGFLMLTTTAFFMVDTSDWFVSNRGEIVCILYSGASLSALAIGAIAWSISKTGPVLASSYAPFQPIATVILSYILLKETLYVGSFIGAILIVMGLYLVAWGQRAAILAAELLPATQDDDGGVTSMTPTLLNLKEPLIVS
ncbi:hypothetical protein BDL97_02G163800 [Sphagnum fallax]|nr:hypothetical protein BDL97_02G163800 [Sphagnum fallax]